MSENQPQDSELAKYLVDLIVNQDHVALKWLQFLITIEAGLVVALGFLLKPGSGASPVQSFLRVAVYVIPLIGIAIALALTWIVVRERKWQAWYVARFNGLTGYNGKVFPSDKGSTSAPVGPRISQIVIGLCILIILMWVFIFRLGVFAS